MPAPIICFGQQPSGFFPKRFLAAKIFTARKLQSQIGGTIVFFYHDADHDPRETKTTLRHRKYGDPQHFNFDFENKLQRKFSPLYLKRVPPQWHKKTTRQLTDYLPPALLELFKSAPPPALANVADFCLHIHQHMPGPDGRPLLDNIHIARSSDPALRTAACDIDDYFADLPHENEIVRARHHNNTYQLHEGGEAFITLPTPATPIAKSQISPSRDSRLRWMQSILHCTHYIAGAGEQAYLNKSDAPEITFLPRDPIDRLDEAWTDIPQ